MFNILKKKKEIIEIKDVCEHEYISLGKYYSVYTSPYRNELDYVRIYMRLICPKCGQIKDKLLSGRGFAPAAFSLGNSEQNYINNLDKSIIKGYEMEEKTIKYKMENKVGVI